MSTKKKLLEVEWGRELRWEDITREINNAIVRKKVKGWTEVGRSGSTKSAEGRKRS